LVGNIVNVMPVRFVLSVCSLCSY